MSTKSTIILTDDNEHWYHDCIDDELTLEFSKKNIRIETNDEDDLVISITNLDCEIYKVLSKIKT
jgi:hypothetical protein